MDLYAYDEWLWLRVLLILFVSSTDVAIIGFFGEWWERNPLRILLISAVTSTVLTVILTRSVGGYAEMPFDMALLGAVLGTALFAGAMTLMCGGIDNPFPSAVAPESGKVYAYDIQEVEYEEYDVA